MIRSKAAAFAEHMTKMHGIRARFMGTRYTDEGAFPYDAILAECDDAGRLKVNEPISSDEMPPFLEFCQKTWIDRE